MEIQVELMTKDSRGSLAEFSPETISIMIKIIDLNIQWIENKREEDKAKWFVQKKQEFKTTGFFFWKKNRLYTEEEINVIWETGHVGGWSFDGVKHELWTKWNHTINIFKDLKKFLEISEDKTTRIFLTQEDTTLIFGFLNE